MICVDVMLGLLYVIYMKGKDVVGVVGVRIW